MKVTTQAELDSALADATVHEIIIDSPANVWLRLDSNGKGSNYIETCGSSHVEARDSSYVVACDSSYVAAWDSSSVEAWDSSSVEAWDGSYVVARNSSSVVACGSSRVVTSKYVAIHMHSKRVTLSGTGVVINVTDNRAVTHCSTR